MEERTWQTFPLPSSTQYANIIKNKLSSMKSKKKRSKLRLLAGTIYYTLRPHIYWHFSGTSFAKTKSEFLLPHRIFEHKTLLLRRLKDVDMWMQHNKIQNLKMAIKNLNGLVIYPGQTFSYWRQIGKPTKRKGYLEGMVLHDGQVISGVGGGICQLSNLIYWMTLHTPLEVVERWRHSYDVFPDSRRTQPFGSGATCGYPNIDLQIKNPTKHSYQLHLEVGKTYLMGAWLSEEDIKVSYEIIEKNHHIQNGWWGGYTRNNEIYRRVVDKTTHKLLREEFITKNTAMMMYEPLLEGANGEK